jgi:riboflavin biosynthesis pyrimidine reductase
VKGKIASSIDGKIAAKSSDSKWITSGQSRKIVQKIRIEYDCVMTGINTVLIDDPLLYPRKPSGNEEGFGSTLVSDIRKGKQFYRAVLDSGLKLPLGSNIASTANFVKTIVFTSNKIFKSDFGHRAGYLSQKNIDKQIDIAKKKLGEVRNKEQFPKDSDVHKVETTVKEKSDLEKMMDDVINS